MEMSGVQLKMSWSLHLQTDVASEIMNSIVGSYIRGYFSYHQNDWDELLLAIVFTCNAPVSDAFGVY